MSDEKLTTGQAFALMEAGEELEWVCGVVVGRYRVHEGRLQIHCPTGWATSTNNYTDLSQGEWRRVPTVHELAAKWRAMTSTRLSAHATCADELDAALAADPLVSLRDFDRHTVQRAIRCAVSMEDRDAYMAVDIVLDHLRKGVVKP